MLDDATPETFDRYVGTEFRFLTQTPDGPATVPLRLTAVSRQEPRDHGVRQHPFTLEFAGDADRTLPQGNYEVEHDALGRGAIFVVPVGPGQLEAVFN